jgi:GNAT superfamily N-acetyltransferase
MGEIGPPRPLRADDERTAFDCGRPSLNMWFARHAWNNHVASVSRVNVLETEGRIAAFVALAVGQLERAALPKARQRNKPDPLPVTLLGQLAVDRGFQGRGCASSLVQFAMRAALSVSDHAGSIGLVVHPLDDDLRRFYARFGFEDLPADPRRAMILRLADLHASRV